MNKFKQMMYRFMAGRYGNDSLNRFLFYVSIVLYVFDMFFIQGMMISFFSQLLLLLLLFRTFSKNWAARQSENYKFMSMTKKIRRFFICLQKQLKDKNHSYFLCPQCQQIVRVPKGRGKIELTCPSCKARFERKA